MRKSDFSGLPDLETFGVYISGNAGYLCTDVSLTAQTGDFL